MKHRELRLGNLVENKLKKEIVEVVGIIEPQDLIVVRKLGENDYTQVRPRELAPLQITEEWLMEAGFHNDSYGNLTKIINNDLWICVGFKDHECTQLHSIEVSYHIVNGEYVHDLQNLYFALTKNNL
jgi:hypothetical protein